ncbi:MAG TPA: ABC transporter substrate-binding protein [Myxococcaceae bacterium]|nr:ABC transporter substrate-binding protein [Myxococcaceae bacterium]
MRRLALAILFASFAAPGLSVPPVEAAQEPIRIGALYPFTGSLALLGEESWRGAEIARQLRNQKGGVAGRQIEFVRADVPDVNAAKSEAERLISREKLRVLLGTYSSSLALAASEVAARQGVTYFELGAISDQITDRRYKTVFRTCPKAQLFSRGQIAFIRDWVASRLQKKPGEIRVSVVHEDSAYGSSVARDLAAEAQAAGVNLGSLIPYDSKSVDLSSVILRLKNENPEVVVGVSYANDAILFGRQAKELGLDLRAFVATGGGHSLAGFAEALGAASDGVFNVDFTQYEVNTKFTPGLAEFVQAYKKLFNSEPRSGHSLANFMGANVLFDILEKTGGDLSADKLRAAAQAYEAAPGTTATGWGVKFGADGQNTATEPFVMQWRNKKLVTVWPERAAVAKPELIKPFAK